MTLDTSLKYLIRHSQTNEYLYPLSAGQSLKTKALSNSDKESTIYQVSMQWGIFPC